MVKRRLQRPYRVGRMRLPSHMPKAGAIAPELTPYKSSQAQPPPNKFRSLLASIPIALGLLIGVTVAASVAVLAVRGVRTHPESDAAQFGYWLSWLSFASIFTTLTSGAVTPFLTTTTNAGNKRVLTRGGWVSIAIAIGSLAIALSSEGIKQLQQAQLDNNAALEKVMARRVREEDLEWQKRTDELASRIYRNTNRQLAISRSDLQDTLLEFRKTRSHIDAGTNVAQNVHSTQVYATDSVRISYSVEYDCNGVMVSICGYIKDRAISTNGFVYGFVLQGVALKQEISDNKELKLKQIIENLKTKGVLSLEVCFGGDRNLMMATLYRRMLGTYSIYKCDLILLLKNIDLDDVEFHYSDFGDGGRVVVLVKYTSPTYVESTGISSLKELNAKYIGLRYGHGDGIMNEFDMRNGVGMGLNLKNRECESSDVLFSPHPSLSIGGEICGPELE